MSLTVALLVGGLAALNVLLVLWSQWSSRHRNRCIHHRLDILSRDLGELQAKTSVAEQERRWQEQVHKRTEALKLGR